MIVIAAKQKRTVGDVVRAEMTKCIESLLKMEPRN
jgi:hypothetical protein